MFYKWRPVRVRPAALRCELKRRPKVTRRAGRGEGGLSPVTAAASRTQAVLFLSVLCFHRGVHGCGCLVSKAWHTETCQCYCEFGRFRSVFPQWVPPVGLQSLLICFSWLMQMILIKDCFIKCSITFNMQQNETARSKRWFNILMLAVPTQPCERKRQQSLTDWK